MNVTCELRETFRAFHETESKHKLHAIEHDGIMIWRLIRSHVYREIIESRGLYEARERHRIKTTEKIWRTCKRVVSSLSDVNELQQYGIKFIGILKKGLQKTIGSGLEFIYRPHLRDEPIEAIVVRFTRPLSGDYQLTEDVERLLGSKCLIIGKPDLRTFGSNRVSFNSLRKTAPKRVHRTFSPDEFDDLANRIFKIFGTDPEKLKIASAQILGNFVRDKGIFSDVIERRKPKCLYLAWNRHYFPAIAAAVEAKIPVYELQHGIITDFHIQYAFWTEAKPPYYPDAILSPGKGWRKMIASHPQLQAIDVGSHHMDKMIAKYGKVEKLRNGVAVFSQQIIGTRLINFVVALAKKCPNFEFHYKMHPNERYANLGDYSVGAIPKNIRFHSATSTYKLMAMCEYQLGVSSTTMVEGLRFGAKTLVVPLPSWGYLRPWVDSGDMHLVATPSQAATVLEKGIDPPQESDEWFAHSKSQNIPLPK